MITTGQIGEFLEAFAPASLAESWDNVGLLVGDANRTVRRAMTCLTVTDESASEAVRENVDLIVAHHPLPFRPLPRLTTATLEGRLLLKLIEAGIGIYSPHTAFDSARSGINQQLAEGIGLLQIAPLVPADDIAGADVGTGRFGRLDAPATLLELAGRVKSFLGLQRLEVVGPRDQNVSTVAVACGSAGSMLEPAQDRACDAMITGETSFHTSLAARAGGVGLVLAGHFASERFAVERLAETIAAEFPEIEIWASRDESDPVWHT
jgi:dinuclear metal center YbgI/SA1388 family protein